MAMSTSINDLKNNTNNNFEDNNSDIEDLIKNIENNLDKPISELINEESENKDNVADISDISEKSEKILKNVKVNTKNSKSIIFNINLINSFLILILFIIINHPIISDNLIKLIKLDNFYYNFIIKGIIFVLILNLLKILKI